VCSVCVCVCVYCTYIINTDTPHTYIIYRYLYVYTVRIVGTHHHVYQPLCIAPETGVCVCECCLVGRVKSTPRTMFIPFQPAAIPAPRQPPITCNFYQRSPVVVLPIMCGVGTYFMNIYTYSNSIIAAVVEYNVHVMTTTATTTLQSMNIYTIYIIYTFFFYPVGGSVVFPYYIVSLLCIQIYYII